MEIIGPDSRRHEYPLGPHEPRLCRGDVELVHKVWLEITPDPRYAGSKMSRVFLHHFDFRSLADHLPLLSFLQHSSQRSQSAIGIRGRTGKFQLLSEIVSDLVDSERRNGCCLQ
jgi:hypothetical protein